MDKRKITTWIMIAVGILLLIWDIVVAANDMRGDTISEIARDTSYRLWLLPWSIGGIMGHLFWHKKDGGKWNVLAMIISSVVLIAANLVALHNELAINLWVPLIVFVGGFVAGHFWWPQRAKELN